jgi:hypothetical protein
MPVEQVKRLHTALVDTRAAYELALQDTDDEEVAGMPRNDLAPPLRSYATSSIAGFGW